MNIVKAVQSEGPLFDVIGALHPSGGFASGLHGRQEKCDEHADDGNDDEEFDEGESAIASGVGGRFAVS